MCIYYLLWKLLNIYLSLRNKSTRILFLKYRKCIKQYLVSYHKAFCLSGCVDYMECTIVISCAWLVFLIPYILSKLWLIIQKVSLMICFLVYYTHLLHLWKLIYLAYVLKSFKIISKYWCSSSHMYGKLLISATQIIYYNKYSHRVVLINVMFFQYLSRHLRWTHLVFPAL